MEYQAKYMSLSSAEKSDLEIKIWMLEAYRLSFKAMEVDEVA